MECKGIPDDALMLVNLHATDLFDDALLDDRNPLLPFASRVVFEVTEQASVRCADELPERVRALRALGFRLAVDDLGAGYSALSVLAELEPEIVKVDMSIIRGVDRSLTKQRVIRSVLHLALDIGSTVICEGVETVRERDTLAALGCDWLQGYLFARPSRGFVTVDPETYK
jgi:EAL domain-containing protein (putative c-di-GMP-specific phosphodiesterase class I)